MASRRLEERRIAFQRYKEDVKRDGKPFYPYAMFHDTVMSLVVVGVIVGLAFIWHYTSILGPPWTDKADPGTTSFVPRPDWYFYFLFYLLRIFKWPDSVVLGTVGIPTILLILLLVIPFVDLRRERRLLRRPVAVVAAVLVVLSMGVLTYKGAVAKEDLASEVVQAVPTWAARQGFQNNQDAIAGAKIFASSGCTACHTYLGTGSSNQGAPDLSNEATRGKSKQQLHDYIQDPSKFGNTIMPKFGFSDQQLNQLASFLL